MSVSIVTAVTMECANITLTMKRTFPTLSATCKQHFDTNVFAQRSACGKIKRSKPATREVKMSDCAAKFSETFHVEDE